MDNNKDNQMTTGKNIYICIYIYIDTPLYKPYVVLLGCTAVTLGCIGALGVGPSGLEFGC